VRENIEPMSARARLEENPFCVLAIPVTSARVDVERAAQLLLAKLELDLADVRTYDTPLGPRVRTPELVRKAAAELRDPDRRLVHEFWALRDPSLRVPEPITEDPAAASRPMARLGWRSRA
jgi:hypothetical protein